MSEQRQFESVRRNYTEQELRAMNEGLVAAVGDVKTLRADKASSMSTMGAAIKQSEKLVFELQERLSLGYELIDCEIVYAFDEPEPGKKKVIRCDTSEVLRIEDMTLRERQQQQSFGFPEPE